MSSIRRPAAEPRHPGANGSIAAAVRAVPSPRSFVLVGALPCAVALLAASATGVVAQEPDTADAEEEAAGEGGVTGSAGSFTFAEQADGTRLMVVPDRNSSLNDGARLFFRCRGDQREVFVAVTEEEGRLGNARDGAGGRYRFGSLPWSEMVTWGSNEAGTAAFMPPRIAGSFADRARRSDRVEVQIVNPGGVRHRFVFPMDGFTESADRLSCFASGADDEED